jgi:hypothetical protein
MEALACPTYNSAMQTGKSMSFFLKKAIYLVWLVEHFVFILHFSQMESLSNPYRNPHDKSISHFMDEETIIEK